MTDIAPGMTIESWTVAAVDGRRATCACRCRARCASWQSLH